MSNHLNDRRPLRRRLSKLVGGTTIALAAVLSPLSGDLLPGASFSETADAAPAGGPDVSRYFGKGAFEGIRRAVASTERGCDIPDDHLTAMVMAPVFKEVSMSETPDEVPSPMTLSRYDEWTGVRSGSNNMHANYGLYPFWDPHGTPYKRAFWHPGVGIFQYDSAGVGANFTAAERLNTEYTARDVTQGIVDRYCKASGDDAKRRAAAWGPWSGLNGVAKSEALFHEMVGKDLKPFSRIGLVDGVDNTGGMQQRTCQVGGAEHECGYIDPAKAQGASWWATQEPDGGKVASGNAPLSAPFYVLKRDGFEERHWLAADTGYPTDISARRRLGQNARPMDGQPESGLEWSKSSDLCDTARPETGSCASSDTDDKAKDKSKAQAEAKAKAEAEAESKVKNLLAARRKARETGRSPSTTSVTDKAEHLNEAIAKVQLVSPFADDGALTR